MTTITVGKRYSSTEIGSKFTVEFIGENKSFIKYDDGYESVINNSGFHNGDFVEVPETRKVTVYLHNNGITDHYNHANAAISSRVVEFEIGKFEKEDEE